MIQIRSHISGGGGCDAGGGGDVRLGNCSPATICQKFMKRCTVVSFWQTTIQCKFSFICNSFGSLSASIVRMSTSQDYEIHISYLSNNIDSPREIRFDRKVCVVRPAKAVCAPKSINNRCVCVWVQMPITTQFALHRPAQSTRGFTRASNKMWCLRRLVLVCTCSPIAVPFVLYEWLWAAYTYQNASQMYAFHLSERLNSPVQFHFMHFERKVCSDKTNLPHTQRRRLWLCDVRVRDAFSFFFFVVVVFFCIRWTPVWNDTHRERYIQISVCFDWE